MPVVSDDTRTGHHLLFLLPVPNILHQSPLSPRSWSLLVGAAVVSGLGNCGRGPGIRREELWDWDIRGRRAVSCPGRPRRAAQQGPAGARKSSPGTCYWAPKMHAFSRTAEILSSAAEALFQDPGRLHRRPERPAGDFAAPVIRDRNGAVEALLARSWLPACRDIALRSARLGCDGRGAGAGAGGGSGGLRPERDAHPANPCRNIKLGVLDLDGSLVSSAFFALIANPSTPFVQYSWVRLPNTTTVAQLTASVDGGQLDAGFVINAGASGRYLSAALNASSPYDARQAMTLVFDAGRNGAGARPRPHLPFPQPVAQRALINP